MLLKAKFLLDKGRRTTASRHCAGRSKSLEAAGFVLYNTAFEGFLAEGLMACKRHDEADAIVSGALARCQGSGEAWCVPEFMRVRALSLAARESTAQAIGLLFDALEIARSQGALAWELTLASTLAGIDNSGSARERLREIVNRTSEGFGTRNYREAVAMLGQCSQFGPNGHRRPSGGPLRSCVPLRSSQAAKLLSGNFVETAVRAGSHG
jgi:hypothetical protein